MSSGRSRLPAPARGSLVAGAREARQPGHRRDRSASHVKSLASDVERSLSIAGTSNANSIVASAARPRPRSPARRPMPRAHQVAGRRHPAIVVAAGTSTAESITASAARPRPRSPPRRRTLPTTSSRWPPMSSDRCRWPGLQPPSRSPRRPRGQTTLVTASSDAATTSSRWPRCAAVAVGRRDLHRRLDHHRRPRGALHAGHRVVGYRRTTQDPDSRYPAIAVAGGTSTAESITAGAREAQTTLVAASSEAATHVKSLAADVERTLTAVGQTPPLPF